MEIKIAIQSIDTDPWLAVFAARAHTELFNSFGPRASSINWHSSYTAIVGYWADEIAGFIMFSGEEKDPTLYVRLGYVRPEYRRQGIYRQLWNALVAHARTTGKARIWGGTHVDNKPMRAFYAAVGRPEDFVTGEFAVKDLQSKED